jgi:hypothetical protein
MTGPEITIVIPVDDTRFLGLSVCNKLFPKELSGSFRAKGLLKRERQLQKAGARRQGY